MCLAVPGKIVEMRPDASGSPLARTGAVDFQGSRVQVSLTMTPEAQCGDWVLVHAGFALTVLDEADARQTWEYLDLAGVADMPAELRSPPAEADPHPGP